MSSPVYCHGCGQRLEIPEDFERKKMRCPQCGVMCELPDSLPRPPKPAGEGRSRRVAKPEPRRESQTPQSTAIKPKPAAARPPAPKEKPVPPPQAVTAKPPLKPKLDDDDDGQPYTVSGGEDRYCPECGKLLEEGAVLCMRCGLNTKTKAKKEQTFQPIQRHWGTGWSFQSRLTLFLICFFLPITFGSISVIFFGADLCTYFTSGVVYALMLSFLLGTFATLDLERNAKGRTRLTKTWKVCFWTASVQKINLGEYEGVLTGRSHDITVVDWIMFLLLFGWGLIPGLIFAYFAIVKQTFYVALLLDHGHPSVTLYRGGNEAQMREIDAVVKDCGRWKVDLPGEGI